MSPENSQPKRRKRGKETLLLLLPFLLSALELNTFLGTNGLGPQPVNPSVLGLHCRKRVDCKEVEHILLPSITFSSIAMERSRPAHCWSYTPWDGPPVSQHLHTGSRYRHSPRPLKAVSLLPHTGGLADVVDQNFPSGSLGQIPRGTQC